MIAPSSTLSSGLISLVVASLLDMLSYRSSYPNEESGWAESQASKSLNETSGVTAIMRQNLPYELLLMLVSWNSLFIMTQPLSSNMEMVSSLSLKLLTLLLAEQPQPHAAPPSHLVHRAVELVEVSDGNVGGDGRVFLTCMCSMPIRINLLPGS